MNSACGEDRHLELFEGMIHMSSTIFCCDGCEKTSFNNDIHFRCTRMDVGRIKTTRAKESHGNGAAMGSESRECQMVSTNGLSAVPGHHALIRCGEARVGEVEYKLIIGEESLTGDCIGSENEASV